MGMYGDILDWNKAYLRFDSHRAHQPRDGAHALPPAAAWGLWPTPSQFHMTLRMRLRILSSLSVLSMHFRTASALEPAFLLFLDANFIAPSLVLRDPAMQAHCVPGGVPRCAPSSPRVSRCPPARPRFPRASGPALACLSINTQITDPRSVLVAPDGGGGPRSRRPGSIDIALLGLLPYSSFSRHHKNTRPPHLDRPHRRDAVDAPSRSCIHAGVPCVALLEALAIGPRFRTNLRDGRGC